MKKSQSVFWVRLSMVAVFWAAFGGVSYALSSTMHSTAQNVHEAMNTSHKVRKTHRAQIEMGPAVVRMIQPKVQLVFDDGAW